MHVSIDEVRIALQTILSKIPPNDRYLTFLLNTGRHHSRLTSKLTYTWEQYLFHYISEGGVTYLVIADAAAGR